MGISEQQYQAMLKDNDQLRVDDNGHGPTPEYYAAFLERAVQPHPALAAQSIVLALPPSANRYWRNYNGTVVVSEEAAQYKQGVAWKAAAQGLRPFSDPVAVYLNVFRQRKAGDLDNYAKVLLDALKGIAYQDDAQIVELHMWRHDDKDNPRVEVEIRKANA